jgi:(S)-3,5-dihydroxyphenylglycine transaminase
MIDIAGTMNFLNEAAGRYPDAISLLAGRPPDQFVDIAPIGRWLNKFIDSAPDPAACRLMLGQYSDTNGICREVLATYLSAALGLPVDAADCMMVNGAQEGMLVALASLCGQSRVALVADPTYVGFAGAAAITGTRLETINEDSDFVQRLVDRMTGNGPQVGCVYLIPDFANPTGRVLTLAERKLLVDVARQTGIVLIEDIAYRRYRYDGADIPTLFSLSGGDHVILIESFAKSLMPGLRAGVVVSQVGDRRSRMLAERLSTTKSYSSVATSPITQAALAGCLLEHGHDLRALTDPRVRLVREQRDSLLAALTETVQNDAAGWTVPSGGFFLTMQLRRPFGFEDCLACAREAQVLVLPMQAFSIEGNYTHEIRLSFSNTPASNFKPVIRRLCDWLKTT